MSRSSDLQTLAVIERERGQLTRLERIIDVLYALTLWRSVTVLPQPTAEELEAAGGLAQGMWAAADEFLMPVVGIALVLIYWSQNNRLFGNLDRTDGRHATSSIVQVMGVMLFGYFVRMGIGAGDLPEILAAQSVALMFAGGAAVFGWRHAVRDQHLIGEELSEAEIGELGRSVWVEPLVAAATIPVAWVGPGAYTLTFLLGIPLVGALFRRFGDD